MQIKAHPAGKRIKCPNRACSASAKIQGKAVSNKPTRTNDSLCPNEYSVSAVDSGGAEHLLFLKALNEKDALTQIKAKGLFALRVTAITTEEKQWRSVVNKEDVCPNRLVPMWHVTLALILPCAILVAYMIGNSANIPSPNHWPVSLWWLKVVIIPVPFSLIWCVGTLITFLIDRNATNYKPRWGLCFGFGLFLSLLNYPLLISAGCYVCALEHLVLTALVLLPGIHVFRFLGWLKRDMDHLISVYLRIPYYASTPYIVVRLIPCNYLVFWEEVKTLLKMLLTGLWLNIVLEAIFSWVLPLPRWGLAAKCSFWESIVIEAGITFIYLPYLVLLIVGIKGVWHSVSDTSLNYSQRLGT